MVLFGSIAPERTERLKETNKPLAAEILRKKNLPAPGETRQFVDEEIEDVEFTNPTLAQKPNLKLLSWNFHRGMKVDQQIEYLKTVNADVLCLQEVDWGCVRSGDQDIALKVAKALGYKYMAYTTEFVEVENPEFPRAKNAVGGGGVHGQAILSKYPIENVECISLTNKSYDWEEDLNEPRVGQRNSQAATIQVGNRQIQIYNTHLENWGGVTGRIEQYKQVTDHADKSPHPSIIVGDLNTLGSGIIGCVPDAFRLSWDAFKNLLDETRRKIKGLFESEAEMWQRTVLAKVLTVLANSQKRFQSPHDVAESTMGAFGGRIPMGKLDWVLLEQNAFQVYQSNIGPSNLSDHRPLIVEVQVV